MSDERGSTIEAVETYVSGPVCVVRVVTADGTEGWGQTAPSAPAVTAEVLHTMVSRHFVGRDAWDLGSLLDETVRAEYKYFGPFLLRAMSGVDTAIWDWLGRATERPVYQLLGGRHRPFVPVYASSLRRTTSPDEEVARIGAFVDAHGFRAAKIKVGARNGRDSEVLGGRTSTLVPLMRSTFGSQFEVSADANGAYSPAAAIRIGRLLEEHDYLHFEEPTPSWELDNIGQVARDLDIPVAAGEMEFSHEAFRRLIFTPLVDVVQPDICYVGGLTRARRVAEMAEVAGMPCTPHCANRSMIQVFTAHLSTAMPACTQFQEWSIEEQGQPFYGPVPQVRDGQIELDDTPGWGVEILPAFLAGATRRVSSRAD